MEFAVVFEMDTLPPTYTLVADGVIEEVKARLDGDEHLGDAYVP